MTPCMVLCDTAHNGEEAIQTDELNDRRLMGPVPGRRRS
jgi:hypothetical protein